MTPWGTVAGAVVPTGKIMWAQDYSFPTHQLSSFRKKFCPQIESFMGWAIHGDPWIPADLGGFGENVQETADWIGVRVKE